ncbi:hypothetical protein BJ322DRAFT_784846 [Thelephora terrestris]|uniref:Secreted protein n=1 Tax=Thelephora terrestris TaxID=56493 RepID=A0A9P6L797_9AGAM|nr:hypothetical protein BJ322DRAFT_784846 [Thelephora terrestris]
MISVDKITTFLATFLFFPHYLASYNSKSRISRRLCFCFRKNQPNYLYAPLEKPKIEPSNIFIHRLVQLCNWERFMFQDTPAQVQNSCRQRDAHPGRSSWTTRKLRIKGKVYSTTRKSQLE